jgi:hypothetical protein
MYAAPSIAALWIACVGDDPAPAGGAGVGDHGERCFADRKCKEGLVCVQETTCLRPGDTLDGGSSGSDGGGGTDAVAGGSASVPEGGACTEIASTDQHFECPLEDGGKETCAQATKGCCLGAGCAEIVGGACPNGASKYRCMASPTCDLEGKVCCIFAPYDPSPACGLASVLKPNPTAAAQCIEPAVCNDGMVQLCSTGSDCIVGTCLPTTIVVGNVSFVVKTCR